MQVRNQSYLRRKNKRSIIDLLRKKTQSYSDLARELKLSNTAIAKIVDDLIEQDIVYREGDVKGRGGINLSINENYGYIIAVDFSRWKIVLSAADFNSNILLRSSMQAEAVCKETIDSVFAMIRRLMEDERLKGKILRGISIASPGKLDKESGVFISNPRFRNLGNVSLQALFEKEFGCPVIVKNDINLALLGEKMYGKNLREVDNALMLHVDVGVGSAILLNGKIYEGTHGFAGEIGFFKLNSFLTDDDDYGNLNYGNYYDSISLFNLLDIVKRELAVGKESILQEKIKERGCSWRDITINDLLESYRQKDELVVRVVHSAARIMGTLAYSLCEFLDVEQIVLTGSVIEFGAEYLQYLSQYVHGYPVAFSELEENATMMGAINAGILAVYDEIL